MNNIYFIILAVLSVIYVFYVVRKKKFSIKESFWWVIAAIAMLILAIWPYSLDKLAQRVGIDYPPSLLFVICIIFLLFICFKNSKRISEQQEKIIDLAQELAIIREKVKDNEK